MARIDIQSVDHGRCGSGSSNNLTILIDNVVKMQGTFQYPCTSSWAAYIEQYAAPYKVPGNTIYLNNELYWGSPNTGSHNVCQSGTCTQVPTPGVNECSTPGLKCSGSTDTGKQIVIVIIILIFIYFLMGRK